MRNGVLIETYWNVNKKMTDSENMDACVLIETYWNVNKDAVLS